MTSHVLLIGFPESIFALQSADMMGPRQFQDIVFQRIDVNRWDGNPREMCDLSKCAILVTLRGLLGGNAPLSAVLAAQAKPSMLQQS